MRKSLLNSVIYQVFVRDFTKEGTFRALEGKLDDIKDLGTDILYLMPIHPIGVLNRKGSLGSPYAIEDYEKINPEYGTMDDFKSLIASTHQKGMKLIIDVVFNHTSCDSRLSKEHPDWFYHNKEGKFANKVGDWADVIDLDHSNKALEEYLSNVLANYVKIGVDGFRFDVASLIPPTFFRLAKSKCEAINPEVIFFGEAVDTGFITYARSLGFHAYSNAELTLAGMDALYHYGSRQWLREFLATDKEEDLKAYRAAFNVESASIPEEGMIVRALENHDCPRITSHRKSEQFTRNLVAFSFFTRGAAFVFNGEEGHAEKCLNFFEKEEIDWHEDSDYRKFFIRMIDLKHRDENQNLLISDMWESEGKTLLVVNCYPDHKEYGIFNLDTKEITISLPQELQNRTFTDLISGNKVETTTELTLTNPIILR